MHPTRQYSECPSGDALTSCAACGALRPRREFLRESGWILASVAAALGIAPAHAAALTLDVTSALRAFGSELVYPIPAQDGATMDTAHDVILARSSNAVYAFSLFCPHQRTRLKWLGDDHRFECPKHHSTYQPDGTFISGRATRGMDRYAIRRDKDTVVVDVARIIKQDTDRAGWDAAVVRL